MLDTHHKLCTFSLQNPLGTVTVVQERKKNRKGEDPVKDSISSSERPTANTIRLPTGCGKEEED